MEVIEKYKEKKVRGDGNHKDDLWEKQNSMAE
jgi:hypothetical protein